jgi:hypothetical protein
MFDVNVVHGLTHGSYGGCAVSHVPDKSNERRFFVWIQPLQLNDMDPSFKVYPYISVKTVVMHRMIPQTPSNLRETVGITIPKYPQVIWLFMHPIMLQQPPNLPQMAANHPKVILLVIHPVKSTNCH